MHCNFICGLSDVITNTFSQSVSQSVHYIDLVDVISAHLPTEHSLFHARVLLSATQVLLSQDRVCGTVYRLLVG